MHAVYQSEVFTLCYAHLLLGRSHDPSWRGLPQSACSQILIAWLGAQVMTPRFIKGHQLGMPSCACAWLHQAYLFSHTARYFTRFQGDTQNCQHIGQVAWLCLSLSGPLHAVGVQGVHHHAWSGSSDWIVSKTHALYGFLRPPVHGLHTRCVIICCAHTKPVVQVCIILSMVW
jgi:hypothetical protein